MPIDKKALKKCNNKIRDLKNWLAVFEMEKEAKEVLNQKLEEIAEMAGHVKDENDLRNCENWIRDAKNWLFVFKEEHNLSEEAVQTIHGKLDEIAEALGHVKV